jgi:ABC-type methionine transport system permease subunit
MDNTVILTAVIIVLAGIILGLLLFIRKKTKTYEERMTEFETEALASLNRVEYNLAFKREQEG